MIEKAQNPKALAIFLSAFLKLSKIGVGNLDGLAEQMIDRLIALRSPNEPYWAWGYSFSWQGRSMLVPEGSPNLVCTAFAAGALFDTYDQTRDHRCLDMAVNAAEYVLDKLYWTEGSSLAGFAYPMPESHARTHNANFLGAALLCRAYKYTGETKFLAPALRVARYSAGQQHADGGWFYGEAPSQHWIDNFHTGYDLCELQTIAKYAETSEFDDNLKRALQFYRAHFFREDGAVAYYHNRFYPIDSHNISQAIITLLAFRHLEPDNVRLARSVFQWAMDHMWDDRGFFYFRKLRFGMNRIPYMRWTEAWMLFAMAELLTFIHANPEEAAAAGF